MQMGDEGRITDCKAYAMYSLVTKKARELDHSSSECVVSLAVGGAPVRILLSSV